MSTEARAAGRQMRQAADEFYRGYQQQRLEMNGDDGQRLKYEYIILLLLYLLFMFYLSC